MATPFHPSCCRTPLGASRCLRLFPPSRSRAGRLGQLMNMPSPTRGATCCARRASYARADHPHPTVHTATKPLLHDSRCVSRTRTQQAPKQAAHPILSAMRLASVNASRSNSADACPLARSTRTRAKLPATSLDTDLRNRRRPGETDIEDANLIQSRVVAMLLIFTALLHLCVPLALFDGMQGGGPERPLLVDHATALLAGVCLERAATTSST